ncbi:MAG: AraC family transcriptional regulator [Chthoniobacteraceae bacterium]
MPAAVALIPTQPASPEGGAWDDVRPGWRLLFGGFGSLGFSIEQHQFQTDGELDWSRSFHPESLELCLNLAGTGEVRCGSELVVVKPGTAVAYAHAREPLVARRAKGERHHFLTLELQRDFLARQVAGAERALDDIVRTGALAARPRSGIGGPRALTLAHEQLASRLSQPPVAQTALPLWFQSKVLELIAEFLFAPAPEMFCERQKRLAHERVERVKELLTSQLENPPSLDALGREVGVSQFYLSRTFSAQTGMTIPQFLRRVRMERAAELLRAGTHNVTEAAFAVGYATGCAAIASASTLSGSMPSASHRPSA